MIPLEVRNLALRLKARGGKVLLIGGGVIDSLMGREVKDWDLEVYGLSLSQIEGELISQGFPADMVGKAFGIIKTSRGGLDIDLSVPRRENKNGIGHKGFDVEVDPSMTPEEAGRRRDLTINSMYMDVETGEIIDLFGGLKDLREGILRATDPVTFREDPLRVLRIMQLLPRKGKVVAPETLEICRSLVEEFATLPRERVFEEFSKLLLKGGKPSIGLKFLQESGWLCHFPELSVLVGCPQNPAYHPEGDVWEHTLRVVDMAGKLREKIPEDWRLAFMFGALLHDGGKPSTLLGDLSTPGHDQAGKGPAQAFMRRVTEDKTLVERVLCLVTNHMRPGGLYQAGSKESAWKRLHNEVRLDVIGYLSRADSLSRYGEDPFGVHGPSERANEFFAQFGEGPIPPVLMGRHLIGKGMEPGREFGNLLRKAYEIQIEEGVSEVEELFLRVTGGKR